jgi:fatty acid desaturase
LAPKVLGRFAHVIVGQEEELGFVTAIGSTLTSLPFTQLKRNRLFYFWYDLFYACVCATLLLAMQLGGFHPLSSSWDWRLVLLFPLVCHAQILCSVYIHNSTHHSFPRILNRIVGELCGLVVISRFASWEVIHRRHHRFSDDVEKDPHPVEPSYWRYVVHTIVGVERQLQRIFFELHGDTPENRRYEKRRAYMSYATSILLILTWFRFLGAPAFVLLFFPASIVGVLHLVHFNWCTHDAASETKNYRPVNLNAGFYRVGNLLWHGIYMHANHHRKPGLFNPTHMDETVVAVTAKAVSRPIDDDDGDLAA